MPRCHHWFQSETPKRGGRGKKDEKRTRMFLEFGVYPLKHILETLYIVSILNYDYSSSLHPFKSGITKQLSNTLNIYFCKEYES